MFYFTISERGSQYRRGKKHSKGSSRAVYTDSLTSWRQPSSGLALLLFSCPAFFLSSSGRWVTDEVHLFHVVSHCCCCFFSGVRLIFLAFFFCLLTLFTFLPFCLTPFFFYLFAFSHVCIVSPASSRSIASKRRHDRNRLIA